MASCGQGDSDAGKHNCKQSRQIEEPLCALQAGPDFRSRVAYCLDLLTSFQPGIDPGTKRFEGALFAGNEMKASRGVNETEGPPAFAHQSRDFELAFAECHGITNRNVEAPDQTRVHPDFTGPGILIRCEIITFEHAADLQASTQRVSFTDCLDFSQKVVFASADHTAETRRM